MYLLGLSCIAKELQFYDKKNMSYVVLFYILHSPTYFGLNKLSSVLWFYNSRLFFPAGN
jgi:hypothetical protein